MKIKSIFLAGAIALGATVGSAQTPPTVSLSANPPTITAGQSAILSWSSTGASSCIGSGFTTGGATSGMATVMPSATTTYSITCNAAIQNAANVTVQPIVPPPPPPPPPPPGNPCGKQLGGPAVFCETFAQANPGIPSRTGGLDPNVWGVSRVFDFNLGQGIYNGAATTQLQMCSGTVAASPPNDVTVCNHQLRESTNDNPSGVFEAGGVTTLAMYPKQPFDFAAVPGTISFDVSNDSHGSHAAWPELWVTNLPVPAPFAFGGTGPVPEHGFALRFHGSIDPGNFGLCPNGNNLNFPRWTVGAATVVRSYVLEDTDVGARSLTLNLVDCVIASPDNSGITNHIEVRIVSANEIDVYAADAGAPTTLRLIATVTNANLTLTRGLVWFEDIHYNADKAATPTSPSQRIHTFVWANLAFDGPFAGRDFAYDALDQADPHPSSFEINLGKESDAGQTASWNVLGLPTNIVATAARVLFNFYYESQVRTLTVIVNGHRHDVPWPYPFPDGQDVSTFAVTVPLGDLVTGTNVVQLGADQPIVTANVDIVLAGVPGSVPVQPGSINTYPH